MANYENGAYTRQAIVDACKHLFYEQGYHETSYSDICKVAHVNRGTIYYHFETKEIICYEVLWEYTTANKHIAEKYCDDSKYLYIIAMCLMWHQIRYDEKMRRFFYQICIDFPLYTGKNDLSYYYFTCYEHMWGAFLDKKDISPLSFASVYGYIMSCMHLLCESPDKFDPIDMFEHCIMSSISIWGMTQDTIDEILEKVRYYITLIPDEEKIVGID